MATKITCKATDCIYNENRVCTSGSIIYDPEEGCLTYEVLDDIVELDEDEWKDEEILEGDDDLAWEGDDLFLDDDEELDEALLDEDDKWSL